MASSESEIRALEDQARLLVQSGTFTAQHLNDRIFNQQEFRRWSNETLVVGLVCLAAGFARAVEMPGLDFSILCKVAFESLTAETRPSSPSPSSSSDSQD